MLCVLNFLSDPGGWMLKVSFVLFIDGVGNGRFVEFIVLFTSSVNNL